MPVLLISSCLHDFAWRGGMGRVSALESMRACNDGGVRVVQVSKIDPSTPQEDAKAHLADKISTFIQARTVPAPN